MSDVPEPRVAPRHDRVARVDGGMEDGERTGRDGQATRSDRTAKQLEWWQLLQSALPLIGAGLGACAINTYAAVSSGLVEFWVGVPLALLGAVCAAIGYRGRLREISSTRPSTGRHYPWLFLGWALVLAGLLVPPYSLA